MKKLLCSDCESDNMNSAFAKNEGETCRQFGCFGKMVWMEVHPRLRVTPNMTEIGEIVETSEIVYKPAVKLKLKS